MKAGPLPAPLHRDRRPVLVIFARAPRLGTVKRRLARDIGPLAALRFYRASLAATLRRLGRDRRWRCLVALTPDHAAWRWGRLAPGREPPRVPQGRGDLGARMARATQPHRPRVVLVGCDIPGLRASDVAAAFRALAGGAGAVFGPAEDGGYWLVGLGARRPARPFASVRWSGPHALADTLANCAGRRVALLQRLRDVDTAEDLRILSGNVPPPP
ncbi:MAG: TIGR04282 family arsenosugar biosynthesis glycosyltransferase [Acetobacteraceae bacterium]|nr:TIGR04282 family arsenosugar biosynthesis glycosyltransferase [Acetobacteraceae bacterium]